MRSYGRSVLGKPQVVDDAVRFRPVAVTLTQRPRQAGNANSSLFPPAVVAGPSVFTAPPIRAAFAQYPRRRLVEYKLGGPVVVNDATVFRPVQATVTRTPRQGFQAHYRLRPPAVVGTPVAFPPVKATLARTPRQPAASHYRLQPPAVVAPAVVFRPVQVTTARRPAQYRPVESRFSPLPPVPAVVVFTAPAVRVNLCSRRGPRLAAYTLRPPTVVNSATTFRPPAL